MIQFQCKMEKTFEGKNDVMTTPTAENGRLGNIGWFD